METRTEIRRRLRAARDWASVVQELEREADALPSEAERSERLHDVGLLAEEVIPDRDRALALYQRAHSIHQINLKSLARMRQVYREMGRLEQVVAIGERELALADPAARASIAAEVGEALLDMGQRDRAIGLLSEALEALPDSMRVRDALAAANYDAEDWIAEVEKLGVLAEKADSMTAARMCLRASRILNMEMPDDPAYEGMLRRVLSYDAQNESANYLFEAMLAKKERWEDLARHHEKRAYAAAGEADRALLYRKFAVEWLARFKDRERGADFFAKALEAAYENGAEKLPSQVAAFALLREILGARKEWGKLLALTDQALAASLGDDEKLYAALLAGFIAWKELGDHEKARGYFERVRQIEPTHPLAAEFAAEHGGGVPGVLSQPPAPVAAAALGETPGPPPVVAPPPVAPVAVPEVETISDAQKALMDTAHAAEAAGPDRAIDGWKKAVAGDPTKRAPRRELARVLRKAERWNALVEALKDEESKAARTPDEKVAVLWELVEIYRERLRLDVMVAGTLAQILAQQPDNLAVLDQLAAQYEQMKRWPDLVSTLAKKAQRLTVPAEKVALHLRVANLYLEKFSNQAEAIKAFEAALEIDADNLEASSHLKSVYEKRRDWEKLIALSRREIGRVGDRGERLAKTVELAKLASEKLKKPAVSIAAWSDVLALDAQNAEALAELEKLYEREKHWDKLAEVVHRQAELAPDHTRKVAFLGKLGILYGERVNDNGRAIEAWKQLLAVEPENKRGQDAVKKLYVAQKAWGELEKFYAGQHKIDEYVRVLERQVETEDDPTKIELWTKIAVLYRDQLAKPDRAMRAFERVLTIDGRHLGAPASSGTLGAAEALIPLYETAKDAKKLSGVLEIQLESTRDPLLRQERMKRLAGLAEKELRDRGAAFGWWLKAFEEDHSQTATRAEVERLARETGGHELLVEAYERAYGKLRAPAEALPLMAVVARVQEEELAETDRALETNRRILDLRPNDAQAVDALERLYLVKQRYGDLLAIYDTKLGMVTDPTAKKTIQYKVGQLYEEEIGDDDKAVSAYRAILAAAGDEREALAALHRIHGKRQEWQPLADVIQRELALVPASDPGHVGLKFRLGQVREQHLGEVAGAIHAYRDILSIDPGHEGARQALERRLGEPQVQLVAAGILEPIYELLEAWPELVGVHEIQLKHAQDPNHRVGLLMRVGELAASKLGNAAQAFDAFARAFREDPTRAEVRGELERIAPLMESPTAEGEGDGFRKLVELYEGALARGAAGESLAPASIGTVPQLDARLGHELAVKVAAAYDERLENGAKAIEYYRRALHLEPDDQTSLEALDRLFSHDEKWQDLLDIYRRKVELAREPQERLGLLFRIASLWEEMLANPEEAISTYKEILGQDASNVRALRALDRLYLAQRHWQDLGDNLVRQLALVADDRNEQVRLLERLAELREKQLRETAAAVDTYRQVLELEPQNLVAIRALERLIGDSENELTIAQILEPIYRSTDEWGKQIGVYEIMVRHAYDPARKISLLHTIGELYEIGGDDGEKAFETYARALREDPAGQETRERLERLARVLEKWPALATLTDEVIATVQDEELKVSLLTRLAEYFEAELGQDEQAVATHGRVLEVEPRHFGAASAIQAIHERNGDYPRLVAALARKADIVMELPERKALLYKAAQIEEEILESPDAAIATFHQVLRIDEIDGPALDALERLYIQLERWTALKDIYAKKAEHAASPDERKQMLFVLGQVYDRELGDVPKAIETYQAILDIDRDDLNAIQALDRLYGQAARWYDLLQILEREVELAGSTQETVALKHRIGALWETELKDLTRAIEAYREALTLDPTHEESIRALDGLLHREGEPVLAAQVLEPIYADASEFEKLIDVYEVMAAHAPSDEASRRVELLHRIAQLRESKLEHYDSAFEAYGRALRSDPSNELTLGHLERLADATRAWDPLARLYDAELQKILDVPRQVDLLLRLARVYEEELNKPDKAVETYRRVLDADGDNAQAIAALDRLFEQGQRWPELAEILRREVRLAGSDEEILAIEFRLGQVYENNIRDLPAAIDVYREILTQEPNHGPTLGALELLFLDGGYQIEIAAILEPLYRDAAEWEKLHKIHEVQLGKLTEPGERQSMYQRLAEIGEGRLRDPERAFRWWGAAFAEDPRAEQVAGELERLAREHNLWLDLVAIHTDVLSRRPELDRDVERNVFLRVARIHDLELGDLARAEEAYLRVLGLDPKDAEALEALDRIYEQSGMWTELADVLKRRVDIAISTDDLVELMFRLGRVQSEVLGDTDAAIACYEKILAEDTRNRQALECLERIYFKREEWQKLHDIYEKMVDVAKSDAEMADVYARMARLTSEALDAEGAPEAKTDRAVELWLRVIDLRGEDPIGLAALADLYERAGEWRELVDVLERQTRLFADAADKVPLYKRLGRVWAEKLGRERNALDAWLQAFALAPHDLETLRALAGLYRQMQQWEDLSLTLRRILEAGQITGEVAEEEMVELYAQLGDLEGETLGRTSEAVDAWQRVLALSPADFRALGALEGLFTREGMWTDTVYVLEKKAQVLEDPQAQIETLLQAARLWEDKVENRTEAAKVYERVRHAEPGNVVASAQLEAIYRAEGLWDRLTEILLERVEHSHEAIDRITLLQQVARIYEQEMGDRESAFVVLQAAFKEDYANESTAKELERLATAANKWWDLLEDYSHVVANLEHDEPLKAADLWVKIARWYGDHVSHVEYAIHSAQSALRLDPRHVGALSALADFHRKRGAFGELIAVLGQHAEIESDPARRVDLYLNLADLLETQVQDPMQAINAYNAALLVEPVQPDALSALDRLYRRHEMWEQLITVLERKAQASDDPDEQARMRLEIGRLWDERLNEPGRAIEAFQKARDVDAQSLPALRALERLYERTGQSEAYLDALEAQLEGNLTDHEKTGLYNRISSAWEERFGKLDRAAEALEKILILDERHMPSYRELERLYRQDKKWDALVDTYRRHILAAGDPATRMDLYCAMGTVYEDELGDADRAIEAFTDVLTFDADEPRALEALGRLYEKIEEWEKATETMSRLVEVTDDPQLKVELDHRIGAIQVERLSDPAAAEVRFLQALGQDPSYVPAMMALQALYKKRGDWLKGAQMMVRAEAHIQHPLEKIKLLFEAAQIYDKRLHDQPRAVEYYAQTIALDPEHIEAGEPLAEIYFREKRWAELEPILDMLARKAAQLKKDNKALNELYYRIARTADELKNNDKALRFYKLAYDLDSTYLPTLLGRANLMFRLEDWDGAGKIYQTILVQHRESQKDTDVVEIYYRLGQVRLKLGERKKALNMFEKALEIDPAHRDTLGAVIDLQTGQGDWEAVVHAKRSLFPRVNAEERFRLLEEIGDVYIGKLGNHQKAVAAYLEALELKPSNHVLLHKLLEVYSETKQWKKYVEIVLRFTEIETDPLVRGKYYYAAGVTSRDELKSLDDAVEYFNRALDEYFQQPDRIAPDAMPKYLKAFEAIDRILTAKKDWPNLGRSYRQMIKRMPTRKGDKILVLLWHSLGEIYRSRLKEYKAAAQAFEVAVNLEPDNRQRREILAELYVLSGPDFADKAIEQHMSMIKAEPFKVDSYKALRKIYMETHQYDKAWCICNTLNFLKKADAEELQFYEQYKPKGFVRAKSRFTDDIWRRVFHPEQDRYVSAIFGAIWQGAALVMAFPFKAYEKQFGLKRKERRLVESDQATFSKVFYYVSQVLNVPTPEVYFQQEQPGEIRIANIDEKGHLVPAFVVGSNLLAGRPEKEVAFACGNQLCYMRPEHYLKKALPTNTDLKIAFLSALVLVQPNFPIKPEQMSLVQQYVPVLRSKIQPQWLEQLHVVVKRFLQNATEVDLTKWGYAVEATAHRVGFLLCGDLDVAAKMVQMEAVQVGGPQPKDKVRELVLYSISEDYFAVRQHLGTIIG